MKNDISIFDRITDKIKEIKSILSVRLVNIETDDNLCADIKKEYQELKDYFEWEIE